MHHATLHIDPTGAAPIGFSQATGMPGDIRIDFKTQGNIAYPDIASLHPQLVLRPFTTSTAYAYDIVINDPTGSSGVATIPGSVMNDLFNVEVYTRNDIGQPQRMIAVGRVDLTGYAYRISDKLGEATYSVGPEGPPGPTGESGSPGERGSRWYTGRTDSGAG